MTPAAQPTVEDVRRSWNRAAQLWDANVEAGRDAYRIFVHQPALLELCGNLRGQRVLDLGCGQGHFTRLLAQQGAQVVAVDVAEEHIRLARRYEAENPHGITYFAADAADLTTHLEPQEIDLATACMCLHDMANPREVLAAVHWCLRVDGRCVASMPHPLNSTPVRYWERTAAGEKIALLIDRYFDNEARDRLWKNKADSDGATFATPVWHRTLAEWSAIITAAGFVIEQISEPRPSAASIAQAPAIVDATRIPYFLLLSLRKLPPAESVPPVKPQSPLQPESENDDA